MKQIYVRISVQGNKDWQDLRTCTYSTKKAIDSSVQTYASPVLYAYQHAMLPQVEGYEHTYIESTEIWTYVRMYVHTLLILWWCFLLSTSGTNVWWVAWWHTTLLKVSRMFLWQPIRGVITAQLCKTILDAPSGTLVQYAHVTTLCTVHSDCSQYVHTYIRTYCMTVWWVFAQVASFSPQHGWTC